STTGKLPQTGTTGVAGTLISGIVTLLCGLGLSRKKK
ncbi:LPXTG cell wall anchor domain-containing protein, partial [Clostridium saudiense]|nr:LPXTG cell wall anchor domain-containing protein [Clostridium saudiense]